MRKSGAHARDRPFLDELDLNDKPYVTVRIGIKPDARNDGGLNLFGRKFGNYETDLRMKLDYVRQNQDAGDDPT